MDITPYPTICCTAIPTGLDPEGKVLKVSLLITPLVFHVEGGKAPVTTQEHGFDKLPAPFDSWAETTGLPFNPKSNFKISAELSSDGRETVTTVVTAVTPPAHGTDTLKVAQEKASKIWKRLLGDARVTASPKPATDFSRGATPPRKSDQQFVTAPETQGDAAVAIQNRTGTVETVGTAELMRNVVMPLLKTHFTQQDPEPAEQEKFDEDLDRYEFALERLDRLGSAGSSAAARQSSEAAEGGDSNNSQKGEFHQLLSSIGDDGTLLSWLGLVLKIEIPVPKGWQDPDDFPRARKGTLFNLKVKVRVEGGSGDWPPKKDAAGEDYLIPGKATPCKLRWQYDDPNDEARGISQATADSKTKPKGRWQCHVDCDDLTGAKADSLTGAGYLLAQKKYEPSDAGKTGIDRRLDTVQFDPLTVLRAALRDRAERKGSAPSGSAVKIANPKPAERRAPLLIGHGITIFRTEGAEFLAGALDSINRGSTLPAAEEQDDVWKAEELARGFVVDVRAREAWNHSETAWSPWIPLCKRKVVHRVELGEVVELSDKIRYKLFELPTGSDEACFSVAASEGATPLSGFVLGWLDGKLYSLTAEDAADLGNPKLKGAEANLFLLETAGGTVVVADVNALLRERENMLASEGYPHLWGGWLDLAGSCARSGGFFLAAEAKFEDEFSGTAGLLKREVQNRLLGAEVAWEGSTPQGEAGPLKGKAPVGSRLGKEISCVVLERSLGKEENRTSYILIHHATDEARDRLILWLESQLKEPKALMSAARGEAILVTRTVEELGLEELEKDCLLVFSKVISDQRLEFLPYLGKEDGEDYGVPLPVTLDLSPEVEIRTLTELQPKTGDLFAGSVFRIKFRNLAVAGPDLAVTAMYEVSRTRSATLVLIRNDDAVNKLRLRIAGEESEYPVGVGTIVEIDDLIPGEQTGDPTTDEQKKNPPPPLPLTFIRGPWEEHRHRLRSNDICEVEFVSDGANRPPLVSRIKVLARDPANCLLGWFVDFSDKDLAEKKFPEEWRDREDLLIFQPLSWELESRMAVIIDDETTIAEARPFPNAHWRTRQMPPKAHEKRKSTLARVYLSKRPSINDAHHADSVELLHGLRGEIGKMILAGAKQDQHLEIQLQLKGHNQDKLLLSAPKPAGIDQTGVDEAVKRLNELLKRGKEVECLVNEDFWIGELRFAISGVIVQKNGEPLSFLPEGAGEAGKLLLANDQKIKPEHIGGAARFELSIRFANENATPLATPQYRVKFLSSRTDTIYLQLQADSVSKEQFKAQARVLRNPADFFARVEGRDRAVFFLPAMWDQEPLEGDRSKGPIEPLLMKLAASGLPLKMRTSAGVLIDEKNPAANSAASGGLRQWWRIHGLEIPPAIPKSDDAIPSGARRHVFPRGANLPEKWVIGRVTASTVYPKKSGSKDPNLWSVAKVVPNPPSGEVKEGDGSNIEPPALIVGLWTAKPAGKIADASFCSVAGEELLPDQVMLDDSLVHWFGNSLAKTERRRTSLESGEEIGSSSSQADLSERLKTEIQVPEGILVPLRTGWKYQFRLRAVWITTDPTSPDLHVEEDSILNFRSFGSELDHETANGFMRVEPFHPPRLGWKHLGEKKHGVPGPDGVVIAPDVPCSEQAAMREFLHNHQFLRPRVAPKTGMEIKLLSDVHWGSPADLLVYQDMAHKRMTEWKKGGLFQQVVRLNQLPGSPLVATRPAAVAVNEAEARSLLEQWEASNESHTLYWDVLWANDEVEACDAWWRYKTSQEEKELNLNRASEGRLLHRLPDAAAQAATLVLCKETSPGVWEPVPGGIYQPPVLKDATAVASAFDYIPRGKWPACREFEIRVASASAPVADHFSFDLKNRTVTVQLPPDADYRLELRTQPRSAAVKDHAFRIFKENAYEETWENIYKGLHPLLSPATQMRLRHATNQPAKPPRKIFTKMAYRLEQDEAKFGARFAIDRASTGALRIQAALEMAYEDHPDQPLPRMPAGELSKVLAVSKTMGDASLPEIPAPGGMVFGRSSEGLRTLRTDEFSVSELEASPRTVSPFGGSEEDFIFSHDLSTTAHRVVYYRVLAVSRWESLFKSDFRRDTVPADAPLVYTNPLSGPYTEAEAIFLETLARTNKETDLWGWYRTDILATRRPQPPLFPTAGRTRTAFAWDPAWIGPAASDRAAADASVEVAATDAEWSGGAGHWHFSRTRVPCCRVWLSRPWYSSGADEKLAVLCLRETRVRRAEVERHLEVTSRWALDSVGTPPADEHSVPSAGMLDPSCFFSKDPQPAVEVEVPSSPSKGAAAPLAPSKREDAKESIMPGSLVEGGSTVRLAGILHTPRFHAEERLWFCDLFVRATVYRPFLWLSLARYQPFSNPGMELSHPVRLDEPVQVLPQRTMEITIRAEAGMLRVRISVLGLVSRVLPRRVICRLQRCVPANEWPGEELAANYNPTNPKWPNPAVDGAGNVDMDAAGNFWQSVMVRRADAVPGSYMELQGTDSDAGGYHGEILVEPRQMRSRVERLRLSVEEQELIPPAWQPQSEPAPLYFDQIEIPREALKAITR